MPVTNLKHETFIREMIAHGNRQKAYKTAYPSSTARAALCNASRLMAKQHIRQRIEQAIAITKETAEYELKQELKARFMDSCEKRSYLAQIARGQVKFLKRITHYNKVIDYYQEPTPSDMIKAIELDEKLHATWYSSR